MEKINFVSDDGTTADFFIVEQTRVNGVNYLLVTDSDEEESQAYILKDVSSETETEANYVMLADDTEFDAVSNVFKEILDDVDLQS